MDTLGKDKGSSREVFCADSVLTTVTALTDDAGAWLLTTVADSLLIGLVTALGWCCLSADSDGLGGLLMSSFQPSEGMVQSESVVSSVLVLNSLYTVFWRFSICFCCACCCGGASLRFWFGLTCA